MSFYSKMKRDILNCIQTINKLRNKEKKNKILGRKTHILQFIKVYNFYKTIQLRIKFLKIIKQKKINKQKNKKNNLSKTIQKDGFTFILIGNTYHKVTKKNYTINDINKWGENRLIVKKNIKKYYDNKKKEKQDALNEKEKTTKTIYHRELKEYPEAVRLLVGKW